MAHDQSVKKQVRQKRKRVASPPPPLRPSQVEPICTSTKMRGIAVGSRRDMGEQWGIPIKVEGSNKLRPIADVNADLVAKMNGGKHACIVPPYMKYLIEDVTAMEVRAGEMFYSVTYAAPDSPASPLLTAKDIVLYGGEKALDAFLGASGLMPLFSGGPHAKSGSTVLTEMVATVDITKAALQEVAVKKTKEAEVALDALTRASSMLAEIPTTTAKIELKRVRKGPGRAAYARARQLAKQVAEADLNKKQLEKIAALDDTWSRIRVALASVDGFAAICKQLLSIERELGNEASGEEEPTLDLTGPVALESEEGPAQSPEHPVALVGDAKVTKSSPPISFMPKLPIQPNEVVMEQTERKDPSLKLEEFITTTGPPISYAPKIPIQPSEVVMEQTEQVDPSPRLGEFVTKAGPPISYAPKIPIPTPLVEGETLLEIGLQVDDDGDEDDKDSYWDRWFGPI